MALKNYRAVSMGQSLGDAAIITFDWTGNTLKPLAPVNLHASRNTAGDVLIEWTRRSRIGGGMRPGSDVPLGEEEEVYLVEIYNGSTLVRSILAPKATINQTTQWTEVFDASSSLTIGADNSLSWTPIANDGIAASSQVFRGDFAAEFILSADDAPQLFGVYDATKALDSSSISGVQSVDYAYYTCLSPPNVRAQGLSTYTRTAAAGDHFLLERHGTVIRYYQNKQTSTAPVPFYESHTAVTDVTPLRAVAWFKPSGSNRGLAPSSIQFITQRAYLYTVGQQTADFGSAQSSVKVRIYQISSIVGRGEYTEATL
jgi:hypothetical protein